MKLIKIKNYIINLNEITTIEFNEKEKDLVIYFKNERTILFENVDTYYFNIITHKIFDNMI